MEKPAIPKDEQARLRVVKNLKILDTPAEERFDRITRDAAHSLNVPISTISIVDDHREFYKSRVGIEASEGSREASFCGRTIVQGSIFIVEDTYKDVRFADNPQVTNPPNVRFYAGVTLRDHTTHQPVGAFCIKDTKPRSLTLDEINSLLDYAQRAEHELNKGMRSRATKEGTEGDT